MKIWIDLTYKGKTVDAYERSVMSGNKESRTVQIEIAYLITERVDAIIQQAKRKLAKQLAKTKAASKKPTKPKPRKKKDNTACRSTSN